jgi:hypothetical protein
MFKSERGIKRIMETQTITREKIIEFYRNKQRSWLSQNEYIVKWFELMPFHQDKFVIYGVGRWLYHIMDWRGCNFYHGRLPLSPVFNSEEEAGKWLIENKDVYKGMTLRGHSMGEYKCSTCKDKKEIKTFHIYDLEAQN